MGRGKKAVVWRVPVAVVLAVGVQGASVVWWASAKDRESVFLTRRVESLEGGFSRSSERQEIILQQLARIEERVEAQLKILEKIQR